MRLRSLEGALAIQRVEVELRTQSLNAPFEDREGSDVHLEAVTCGRLKGQGQDGVRLAAFCFGHEQNFSGLNASAVVLHVHGRGLKM